jgi:tRNA (cytidine/uridine-2'-O-)-methyltransferase
LFNIVLFEPEIHYNTGNVGRTCAALGAKLWLVRPLGFRMDDKHLHRAALDYWEYLDYQAVDDWSELVGNFPEFRPWIFTKTATKLYTQAHYRPGDILVFGSETRGLPPSIITAHADRCLRIPMDRKVRSLNLAVSVGIAAYEALRQITCSAD